MFEYDTLLIEKILHNCIVKCYKIKQTINDYEMSNTNIVKINQQISTNQINYEFNCFK